MKTAHLTPLSSENICHTIDLIAALPPIIRVSGKLSEASQALFMRLADGQPCRDDDELPAHDLMRAVLDYEGRAAPLVSQIDANGISLSPLVLEALSCHREQVLIAVTGRLRSKYARSLMMSLMAIGDHGMIEPSLSDMRRMLGAESALRTSSHLLSRAIIPAARELMACGMIVHVVDIRDRRARGKVNAYRVTWMMGR